MSSQRHVRNSFGALYAWSGAVYFGAVLLDVAYSAVLRSAVGPAMPSVSGEVSDFLLLLAAPLCLAALVAVALAWDAPPARNLFGVSLLLFALEFLAPVVLGPVLRTSSDSAMGLTPFVRLVPLALASLFALIALGALFREPLPG